MFGESINRDVESCLSCRTTAPFQLRLKESRRMSVWSSDQDFNEILLFIVATLWHLFELELEPEAFAWKRDAVVNRADIPMSTPESMPHASPPLPSSIPRPRMKNQLAELYPYICGILPCDDNGDHCICSSVLVAGKFPHHDQDGNQTVGSGMDWTVETRAGREEVMSEFSTDPAAVGGGQDTVLLSSFCCNADNLFVISPNSPKVYLQVGRG